MYENEFRRILDASRNKSLTIFVGAGVSKLSKAPKWSELIDGICDELGCAKKKVYSSDDYLRIPQMYYYSVEKNNKKYYSFINKCFSCSDLKPNVIHKMMLDLAPASFITTNFDDLLEKASVQHFYSYKAIACDEEVSQIGGDKYILKIHGDLKHQNIVLKEEDYLNYSETFKLIETLLKSIFSTNTVVMIGYGLNDYNIKLILNWAKSLLEDHFNKPIFIYTDDEKLSKEELTYHESRGLSVIEYYKCDGFCEVGEDKKFENRYKTVINAIKDSAHDATDGKTEEELFDVLFSALEPLDAMWALKPHDIQKQLSPYAIVEQNGVLRGRPDRVNIFEYFVELHQMDEAKRNKLPRSIIDKYMTVMRVFSKGRIFVYMHRGAGKTEQKIVLSDSEPGFADDMCLNFNYLGMQQYAKKLCKSPYDNYKKAFYLAKLARYQEAYELFCKVAAKTFAEGNYLLYYLAQVNRKNLYNILKNINKQIMYLNYYNLEDIESDALTVEQAEHIFESLPHETREIYECFKDLDSANLLYENAYESFVEGKKLQSAIDNNTIEFGMTSVKKVICRINNNLHFALGNGLYFDEYSEFKNAIAYLMELVLFKYSIQDKKYPYGLMYGEEDEPKVIFDYRDFYCFIQYFKTDTLEEVFRKYNIRELEFSDINAVCASIGNIIDYYDVVLSQSKERIEKVPYQHKIKSCLVMLRHMNVTQELVEKICAFIFKYEFSEIDISEKVLFLDYQIDNKGMANHCTATIIEDKLISYIDMYINSLQNGDSFDVLSRSRNINYYNLVHYIGSNLSKIRLAKRFNKLLNIGLEKTNFMLFNHCTQYLSANMQKKIIRAVKNRLKIQFNFEYFGFLVGFGVKIEKETLRALIIYLDNSVKKSNIKTGILIFPHNDPYDDLITVGYWCLLGLVPAGELKKYVGYNDKFDFYYLYERFDFNKFNVEWLLDLTSPAIKKIAENTVVKAKVRLAIAKGINEKSLRPQDASILGEILAKYFC